MSVRYSYLALEADHQMIVDWFSALDDEVTISENPDHLIYYFREMAEKPLPNTEEIAQNKTPLVWVFKPQQRRGTLWTNAEVHFTPTPLRSQFPALDKVSRAFAKWLRHFDLVFSHKTMPQSEWSYFLEAGVQNFTEELFALPNAMNALRSGQYFIHRQANNALLDALAQRLRLRGYHVDPA